MHKRKKLINEKFEDTIQVIKKDKLIKRKIRIKKALYLIRNTLKRLFG